MMSLKTRPDIMKAINVQQDCLSGIKACTLEHHSADAGQHRNTSFFMSSNYGIPECAEHKY
jgi:hypothetical protein